MDLKPEITDFHNFINVIKTIDQYLFEQLSVLNSNYDPEDQLEIKKRIQLVIELMGYVLTKKIASKIMFDAKYAKRFVTHVDNKVNATKAREIATLETIGIATIYETYENIYKYLSDVLVALEALLKSSSTQPIQFKHME
jgi:hypothetical protein